MYIMDSSPPIYTVFSIQYMTVCCYTSQEISIYNLKNYTSSLLCSVFRDQFKICAIKTTTKI